jgi:hypothetical protein
MILWINLYVKIFGGFGGSRFGRFQSLPKASPSSLADYQIAPRSSIERE